MANSDPGLAIGAVVTATGVSEATLRSWESRYGFPTPEREPSGHRRYSREQVEQIRRVAQQRAEGMPLKLAIERVGSADGAEAVSIFAQLRKAWPRLAPQAVKCRHLASLTRAAENESAARAEHGLLVGSFQRESIYRRNERRWRDLTRVGLDSFVLADFERPRNPARAPSEVPIAGAEPMLAEWGFVCLAHGHSVCLVGRERPGQQLADQDRIFEGFFSVEPPIVRAAAETAAQIAAAAAPEVAARARGVIGETADADPDRQLQLAGEITSRFFSALD